MFDEISNVATDALLAQQHNQGWENPYKSPSHTTHRAAPQWAVLNLNADELAGFSWHPWHWFVKVGEPQKADQVVKGIEAAGEKL